MNKEHPHHDFSGAQPHWPRGRWLVFSTAILVLGALSIWWLTILADRDLRTDLLGQTSLVAGAVHLDDVRALSGTEADLESPAYQRLEAQLSAVRAANSKCRFVYIMGRNPDGSVFFYVDSEPTGSVDKSPPGQVYQEVSDEFLRSFDTRAMMTEGPVTDRWGTWVTALVPLMDPDSGELVAVLAMDVDARDWKWEVAARAALPAGLISAVVIGLLSAFFVFRRAPATPKPVLRRLLPTMAVLLVALFVLGAALMWQQQRVHLRAKTELLGAEIALGLRQSLEMQAQGLTAVAQSIALDTRVHDALRDGDTERLLSGWQDVGAVLRRESAVSTFSFLNPGLEVLARISGPEESRDVTARLTALEAERTGRTASGIDLDTRGTFILRVMQPVFDDQVLLGYVELGRGIESMLGAIQSCVAGVEIAVVVPKEALERDKWEAGMAMLEREADWDRLERAVIIYASQGRLPEAFTPMVDHIPDMDIFLREANERDIHADGKTWRVVSSCLKDASGTEVGCLLVMIDITDLKKSFRRQMTLGGSVAAVLLTTLLAVVFVMLRRTDAGINSQQASLRESEARFRTLFSKSPVSIIIHDAETGAIVDANEVACKAYGFSSLEELQSCNFWSDPPYSSDEALHWIRKARAKGVQDFDWKNSRNNGEFFWEHVTLRSVVIDGKDRILSVAIDITERMRVEEERERLQVQLLQAQKMESIGILAGGVAHDFNNLLHMVRVNIEMLARDISSDSRGASRLQTIAKGLDRAAKLVQQLLLFGRKAESNFVPVDVNHEVLEVVRMTERTIPKMVSLEQHLEPALRPIMGDPVHIEQALLNLTNNAVDAMPEGGRLIIETCNVDIDQGFAKRHPGSAAGPHVLLTVTDTGFGMDATTLEHVFDPFFTTKGVGKGTGLGLASVYGIVKGHGGHTQCYSVPGRGTTFRLYLPASGQAGETSRAQEIAPPLGGGGETILVVDDEPEIRNLTREALEDLGFSVLTASSGEKALEAYRQHGPNIDLVLLDLNMPGMGGHKCLRELLRLNPAVRVLIASGYSAHGQARETLASGARGYIGKPYRLQDLEAKVREVLDADDR